MHFRNSFKILCIVFALAFSVSMQADEDDVWLKHILSKGQVEVKDMTTDYSGTVYLAGEFSDQILVEKKPYNSPHEKDAFIAKYHEHGNKSWVKLVTGTGETWISGVAIDRHQNLYAAINFTENLLLDSLTYQSKTGTNILVCKYNMNGKLLWANHLQGVNNELATNIASDSNGNVFVTGSYSELLKNKDRTLLKSGQPYNLFLVRFASNGTISWTRNFQTSMESEIHDLTTDYNNNVYVAGKFSDKLYFQNETMLSQNGSEIFLAKFNTNGKTAWAKAVGRDGHKKAIDIAIDNYGSIVIAGSFKGDALFSDRVIKSSKGMDIFLTKYDENGNFMWLSQIEGKNGNEVANDLAIGLKGEIYLTGRYDREVKIGRSRQLKPKKANDFFVGGFTPNGTPLWAERIGGSRQPEEYHIASSLSDNLYISGCFSGEETFGMKTLGQTGAEADAFIWKVETDQLSVN